MGWDLSMNKMAMDLPCIKRIPLLNANQTNVTTLRGALDFQMPHKGLGVQSPTDSWKERSNWKDSNLRQLSNPAILSFNLGIGPVNSMYKVSDLVSFWVS